MSHYMTALAMRQEGLKPAEKVILYWLADHHNSETNLCCPSLATLAIESEMGKSTVSRHLIELENMGLIYRNKRQRDNGSQTSTSYVLSMKQPVPNRDGACPKSGRGPVPNRDALNLGILNLGIEQDIEANASQAFAIFNEFADRIGWSKCQKQSKARTTRINARLKDCGGIDGWRSAMEKASTSDFLCNRSNANFSATIDFLLQESSFTKLIEGNYDNRTHNGNNSVDTTTRAIYAAARIDRSQEPDNW